MLNASADPVLEPTDEAVTGDPQPTRPSAPLPLLRTAVRIVEQMRQGSLLYIAADDARAATLAELVRALEPEACVVLVPASDALPGDDAPASPANAGQRVAALRQLRERGGAVFACITSAEASVQLLAPPSAFDGAPPVLTQGEPLNAEALLARSLELGYVEDDRVDEPGEIAVRGGVIDIFPVDATAPVRVELDGENRILAIRSFDPVDQLTIDECNRVAIGRASEPPVNEGVTLLAHLAPAALVEEPRVAARRHAFRALARDAARFNRAAQAVVSAPMWEEEAGGWERLDWRADEAEPVARFVERRVPLAALAQAARPVLAEGGRLVVAGSARDLRFLRPRLAKRFRQDIAELAGWNELAATEPGTIHMIEASADGGFATTTLMVAAAANLLGSRALVGEQTASTASLALESQAELHVGDVVVHEDHGLCRLLGIEPLPAAGEEPAGDALVVEFADGARRLVPTSAADRVWRYGGEADAVRLDKLDGSTWDKRRAELSIALAESAKGLVALAAERDARELPPIVPDPAAYEQFASGFPFTETADQARAIGAVRDDLASGKPMDRLVIGDVGYGKTEVALRAAALVALAGGQVALAAPTTVLVRQHLQLFQRRFAEAGIAVAGLSRLSTPAEKKAVKAGLADGSISIVIGTAAVAGKGVDYANLQLVVIDEEQRFGAADKAKLRALHDGHVLTLSATPIPRTLQSALVGLQQMSVIATPPARRQPIRTTVEAWDDAHVRTALMRERGRRGQSFVVVPQIEDMAGIAEKLAKIFPEGTVVQAHGKMPAADLDTAMTDFADGQGDVLLATNIIEAGLDVPRANTMIVWRADRFGLSQLHQLRGRVGRGGRRGQILLLTDGEAEIAEATLKRLRTLQAFDRLGAGFAISARDLDLRGAGNLMGDDQTGHMRLIGVDLYQHLLGQALRAARGEAVDDWQPELNLGLAGALPEEWLPDMDLRVQLYGRLARLTGAAQVDSFEQELADRFGELPDLATALLTTTRIRLLAHDADVARIDAGPGAIAMTPRSGADTGGWAEAGLEASGDRWLLKEKLDDAGQRADRVAEVLEALG